MGNCGPWDDALITMQNNTEIPRIGHFPLLISQPGWSDIIGTDSILRITIRTATRATGGRIEHPHYNLTKGFRIRPEGGDGEFAIKNVGNRG